MQVATVAGKVIFAGGGCHAGASACTLAVDVYDAGLRRDAS